MGEEIEKIYLEAGKRLKYDKATRSIPITDDLHNIIKLCNMYRNLEAKLSAALEVVKAAKADHDYHHKYKRKYGPGECRLCDALSAYES